MIQNVFSIFPSNKKEAKMTINQLIYRFGWYIGISVYVVPNAIRFFFFSEIIMQDKK